MQTSIKIEEKNGEISIDEPGSAEIARCAVCEDRAPLRDRRVLIVRGANEEIYCARCWALVKPTMEWVGVLCALVYDHNAVHSLFGSPFDRLRPVEGGVIMFANSIKQRQLQLF